MHHPDAPDSQLLAVCAGTVAMVGRGHRAHRSAFVKRPRTGAVRIDAEGVPGDGTGDTENHGGIDQALYAYAQQDAAWWEDELDRDLPPGAFGENLRICGIDVTDSRVGDRWRLGAELEVVVTAARIPCATLSAAWDEKGVVDRFLRAGRPGAYLRVVVPGTVLVGDPVAVVHRAADGTPSVAEVSTIKTRERHRAVELVGLADLAHRDRAWAAEVTSRRG